MPDVTYTLPELEKILKISRRKLHDLILSGELPSYKIGARRFVRDESLRDFLRRREAKTTFKPKK